MSKPTIFINVHRGALGLEAFDTVHTSRFEATEAAEQYANTYEFTVTDTGNIDLTDEFSEGYQEKRDYDAMIDARIDLIRDIQSFTLHERA